MFDTSAEVHHYVEQVWKAAQFVDHIFDLKAEKPVATLLIPDFSVAEVFNNFARLSYEGSDKKGRSSKEQYEACLKQFREDIHWGNVLYPYELNRYHILASDDIIPVEYEVERISKAGKDAKLDQLGTSDILVLAMAAELAYTNGRENVCLLTADDRMKRVADELRCRGEQDIVRKCVKRTLDYASWWRWSTLSPVFHKTTPDGFHTAIVCREAITRAHPQPFFQTQHSGQELQIFRPQSGPLRDPGHHLWANFYSVVKGPHIFPSLRMCKNKVRTSLRFHRVSTA